MSGAIRRRLGFGAATLAVCGALATGMAGPAPLVLSPITPSLPPGFYLRSFASPAVGSIVAFKAPAAARKYKASVGETVHPDFMFLKPVVAGPGDRVCLRMADGLWVNGRRIATVTNRDVAGRPLPVWQGCRRLRSDEFFTLSSRSPNSFDGRHYGPIRITDLVGVYRALFSIGGALS